MKFIFAEGARPDFQIVEGSVEWKRVVWGMRSKGAAESVETGRRIGRRVKNERLAVHEKDALAWLPDNGDMMPLPLAKRV